MNLKTFLKPLFFSLLLLPIQTICPPKAQPKTSHSGDIVDAFNTALDALLARNGFPRTHLMDIPVVKGLIAASIVELSGNIIKEAETFYANLLSVADLGEEDTLFLELIDGILEGYAHQQAAKHTKPLINITFQNLTCADHLLARQYKDGLATFVSKDEVRVAVIQRQYKHDTGIIILDLAAIIFNAAGRTTFNKSAKKRNKLTLSDRITRATRAIREAKAEYMSTLPTGRRSKSPTTAPAELAAPCSADSVCGSGAGLTAAHEAKTQPVSPTNTLSKEELDPFLADLTRELSTEGSFKLAVVAGTIEEQITRHITTLIRKSRVPELTNPATFPGCLTAPQSMAFAVSRGFVIGLNCLPEERHQLLSSAIALHELLLKNHSDCAIFRLANGFIEGSLYKTAGQRFVHNIAVSPVSADVETEYIRGTLEYNVESAPSDAEAEDAELAAIARELAPLAELTTKASQIIQEYHPATRTVVLNLKAIAFVTGCTTKKVSLSDRRASAEDTFRQIIEAHEKAKRTEPDGAGPTKAGPQPFEDSPARRRLAAKLEERKGTSQASPTASASAAPKTSDTQPTASQAHPPAGSPAKPLKVSPRPAPAEAPLKEKTAVATPPSLTRKDLLKLQDQRRAAEAREKKEAEKRRQAAIATKLAKGDKIIRKNNIFRAIVTFAADRKEADRKEAEDMRQAAIAGQLGHGNKIIAKKRISKAVLSAANEYRARLLAEEVSQREAATILKEAEDKRQEELEAARRLAEEKAMEDTKRQQETEQVARLAKEAERMRQEKETAHAMSRRTHAQPVPTGYPGYPPHMMPPTYHPGAGYGYGMPTHMPVGAYAPRPYGYPPYEATPFGYGVHPHMSASSSPAPRAPMLSPTARAYLPPTTSAIAHHDHHFESGKKQGRAAYKAGEKTYVADMNNELVEKIKIANKFAPAPTPGPILAEISRYQGCIRGFVEAQTEAEGK